MDQAKWRNAISVWQPRRESAFGSNNRGYAGTSRRSGVQHERHTFGTRHTHVRAILDHDKLGFWGYCPVDN